MTQEAAGDVKIVMTLDGASYSMGMRQLKQQLGDFPKAAGAASREMQNQMKEARGAVAVLGEEVGVHLPRHVQAFVAKLPGVASAMSAAFNAVAIIAIGSAIYEATKKVTEFVEKNEDAARKNAQAWQAIAQPMEQTNDELRLANDKIEDAIAKLEGKPRNGIKDAIDEAIVSADTLGEHLGTDIQKISDQLKVQQTGFLDRLQGYSGSKDITQNSKQLKDDLDQIDLGGHKKLKQLRTQGATEEQLATVTADLNAARKARIDKEIDWVNGESDTESERMIATASGSKRLPLLTNYGADLARASDFISLTQDRAVDQARLGSDQAADDAYQLWREQYTKQLEEQQKQVDPRDKWIVGSRVKVPEAGKAALQMQREDNPSDAVTRDVAGEMSQDLGRYGERWRTYNDAVRQSAEMQASFSAAAAMARTSVDEETGAITRHEAAIRRAAIEQKDYADQIEAVKRQMSDVRGDGSLSDVQRATQQQQLQNRLDQLTNSSVLAGANSSAQIQATSTIGEFTGRIREAAQQFTNLGEVLSNITLSTLGNFNSTLMHVLTTPASMLRGEHPWRALGASVAESAGGSALQFGEGQAMKLLLGKNPNAKLGSKENPMYTRSADGLTSANGVGGLLGKLFGGKAGGESLGLPKGLGSFFGAALHFLPGFADGGSISSNMPAIVGENGPELFMPSTAGRIIPNHQLGGGGDVAVHIDARGANDPAAVEASVHRAMAPYISRIPDMVRATNRNDSRRVPAMMRGR